MKGANNMKEFQPEDYVYYLRQDKNTMKYDTFPGQVLAIGKKRMANGDWKVKVRYNHWEGDKVAWVNASRLTLQKGDE